MIILEEKNMALIKNEIPILEYDTEQQAVLMPGHGQDYKFTKKAVMLFMEAEIDNKAIKAIERALKKNNKPYRKCKTWTTDGFYRETKEMVLYRKEEGYSVVEMECASLAACAKMRGITFGQLLFTADSLADVEEHNERNWGNKHFAYAMKLAFDAIVEM